MDKEHVIPNSLRWFSLENYHGEIWKEVVGYEKYYAVSNYGRVKSLKRFVPVTTLDGKTYLHPYREKIMKCIKDRLGYLTVEFRCLGKRKTFKIHRLVMLNHVPNPNNYPTINHIDEDKANNIVTNLEWCTVSHNITWGEGHKRRCKSFINNNRSKVVFQYDEKLNFIKEYPSAAEAERQTGISGRSIRLVCDVRSLYAGGYIWLHNPSDISKWKEKRLKAKRNGRYKQNYQSRNL